MTNSSPPTPQGLLDLHHYYQSGKDDLGTQFFVPCLSQCIRYSRAAGYFSSSALKTWASALSQLISNDTEIRLIISPILSTEDKSVLIRATSEADRQRILAEVGGRVLEEVFEFAQDRENVQRRLRLFGWMLANSRIVLKFAIPRHIDNPGMYHEKSGVFQFPDGSRVAFVGSANETLAGHSKNYEKIHVFRSWVDEDEERLRTTEDDFEAQWNGNAPGLLTVPLSARSLRLIQERTQTDKPSLKEQETPPYEKPDPKWRHQEEACDKFVAAKAGVIEMATGTGKTRTALKILSRLVDEGSIDGAVIAVDGTDLLDQWHDEVLAWVAAQQHRYSVLRHYDTYHEAQSFALNPTNSLIVISRQQLPKLLRHLSPESRNRLMIVHDEVHGLGAPSMIGALKNEHALFQFRLGLSATPIRDYDPLGTQFIEEEIGPVIYRFGLEDAIKRGILCEFDYVPLPYDLTQEDKRRLQLVHSKKAAREKMGTPMSAEEFWTELSKVYKTAEQKPFVFADYLKVNPAILKASIIFVEEKSYGELLLPMIHEYTHLYRTYYAEDDRTNLVDFAAGKIDCLITCHRISQGIDIKKLQGVVLVSSSRSRLETIQRIGRCLRTDPDEPHKRAVVVDFVRPTQNAAFESADDDRCDWLTDLSKARRSE